MRKNLTKIAMSCILILSIIGCAGTSLRVTDDSSPYETGANEVCTYKIAAIEEYSWRENTTETKYIHYNKTCTEYGSNVIKIMGENITKQEK